MYAGDIIDGLSIDNEMFGDKSGSFFKFTLDQNESVTSIVFGYHTHRLGYHFDYFASCVSWLFLFEVSYILLRFDKLEA